MKHFADLLMEAVAFAWLPAIVFAACAGWFLIQGFFYPESTTWDDFWIPSLLANLCIVAWWVGRQWSYG